VEYEEKEGSFWHIKYPVTGTDAYLEVATTRPETMLGDTAVAVHPEDERYKDFIGKTVTLPLMNREIPIIADDYVEREFGTGVVKITPAHDPNDFEIGLRHDLEMINVMNPDATINENGGKYAGLDRYEARKQVVRDLEELGLLVKIKPHHHNVGSCYRCNTVIEPRVSHQWFVKMKPLAEPAIEAVRNGTIKFVPERFSKIYFNWMENIQDWCISRQLWWGHRIPAYYCDDCGHITVSREAPEKCQKCGSARIRQDEDVLDTWFSSALWPFSTLGWPEKTADLEHFYPTSVLVTAYDIIFFWVARMIFSGLEQMGKEPFSHVVIHGLVRDAQGRKMSKSLGNGIDPLDVIEKYGTDALRYALTIGTSPGNDLRFSDEKLEASRNFANKIWNAFRFVMMNFDEDIDFSKVDPGRFTSADKWILSRINTVAREVTENLERFEIGIALHKIYEFIWDEFCDWYIELVKPRLYDQEAPGRIEALYVLNEILKNAMKLLHPFMPFITEEIYGHLITSDESIMISEWPEYREGVLYPEEERVMKVIMDAIRGIRNRRLEMNVPASRRAKAIFVTSDPDLASAVDREAPTFKRLASISDAVVRKDKSGIADDAVAVVVEGMEVFLPLEELIDMEKEIERLEKEKANLEMELDRVEKKLSNAGFVAKAPKAVVEAEKEKEAKYRDMYRKVIERLETIKGK
jgi:valyl-tRNA synthetase